MRFKTLVLPALAIAMLVCFFAAMLSILKHNAPVPGQSVSLERQNPQKNPLIRAAAAGDPERVRRLLAQGADVHARSAVPHEATAMQAALYHRQNDIERVVAVPNDPGGESLRNQPMPPDGVLKDENYREVIGMLRQAASKAHIKTHDQHHTTH